SVLDGSHPRALVWMRSLLADSLSRMGAHQRWAGYALARALSQTEWDPDLDISKQRVNRAAVKQLGEELAEIASGKHIGARLLTPHAYKPPLHSRTVVELVS